MEKENARKQTLEQLHERRKQVVRLHKKSMKVMQIVTMTGLSYPAVRATIDLFDPLAEDVAEVMAVSSARFRRRLSSAPSSTIVLSNSRWIFACGAGPPWAS
jgi:hypothetical protein